MINGKHATSNVPKRIQEVTAPAEWLGNLVGGPLDGKRIHIDARIHGCAVVEGHWYFRVLPSSKLGYSRVFDYLHDAKCCDR